MAGLRERKKQQMRDHIAETAQRLFGERGFDAVTVGEIAAEADVSEATVFNYFPTKEDLFYSGMDSFESLLVEAVRRRPKGSTVLRAFQGFVIDNCRRLALDETAELTRSASLIVASSASLRAREREIVARYIDVLAALIRADAKAKPDDVEPVVVATALMGVQRAVVAYVRAKVLEGWRGPKLATAARRQANRGFRLLETGLATWGALYGAAPSRSTRPAR
jgi:AcrR family transcriptional regulator